MDAESPELLPMPKLVVERSRFWPKLRREHLKKERYCQVCGTSKFLVPHHIKPVHLFPELELKADNLITLCESPGFWCHLLFGHLGCFRSYNPQVVSDVRLWHNKILNRCYRAI